MLTDTHTHLGDPVFDDDREEVLERARAAGVGAVIVVAETLREVERNLELAERHPELRPTAGLFPTVLDPEQGEAIASLARRERHRLVGIGEVGLDYWKVEQEAEREVQRDIFARFVELADELDLPLNVHSRSAGRQTIEMLLELDARRVQLHAFDGRAAKAQPAVEAGYFFSVPPSIVRSRQKQKLVRRLPLESLLVETDSPVLGADPQERNEPANVRVSLGAIAELKGLAEEEVEAAVVENTRRLYGDRLVRHA
ncbi:MAG: TatD family hydrolase [Thermoanaerobaculia bacterium]|nr:TatD family hydrolase [Thermoanaerobaculia bacterium]